MKRLPKSYTSAKIAQLYRQGLSTSAIAERFGSFGEASVMGFPYSTLYGERSIHIMRSVTAQHMASYL